MLIGLLAGFLSAALGWQINLIAIQRGLQRGRFAAFLVGSGAVLADILFLWTGLAGTAPLLEHPEWWGIIRWVGIVVILILAARVFFVHSKPPTPQVIEVQKRNPTRNFVVGFLVVITNPVVFLMWVGVIGFLRVHFPEARSPWFREFFLAGFFVGGLLWFVLLALVFLRKLKRWTEANHTVISHISGWVLVAVALFLIFFEKF